MPLLFIIMNMYHVERSASAEDEIDCALDVTILEEVVTPVVAQRVLKSDEFRVEEGRLVTVNPQSQRLSVLFVWVRPRRRILHSI